MNWSKVKKVMMALEKLRNGGKAKDWAIKAYSRVKVPLSSEWTVFVGVVAASCYQQMKSTRTSAVTGERLKSSTVRNWQTISRIATVGRRRRLRHRLRRQCTFLLCH